MKVLFLMLEKVIQPTYGFTVVKFAGEPEPLKCPLLGYRHCTEDGVTTIAHAGMTFHWCAPHAKDPTCGVTVGT